MTDTKRKKRPRDANELAKLIVDIATATKPTRPRRAIRSLYNKDPHAVALGKRGGKKMADIVAVVERA